MSKEETEVPLFPYKGFIPKEGNIKINNMKRFLELQTRTYIGKDLKDYSDALKEEDDLLEGDEWKASSKGEPKPPKYYLAKVFIDPDKILSYVEVPSLEEQLKAGKSMKFDCVDICLVDQLQITVTCTMDEFRDKLREFYGRDEI